MDKRFGFSVFPPPMPKTPAGKFLLLSDLTTPIVDEETCETYAPILTPEEGPKLLETPMNDDQNNANAARAAAMQNMGAINAQSMYQDQEAGISGMLRRATREENEGCAVLAESHGFPELARHIRMRVSTSAIPEKK